MATTKTKQDAKLKVDGHELIFTNADKVFWKEEGITKGDVIEYYHRMSPILLPYLKDRPMVMRRNPDGAQEAGLFQKDTSNLHLPTWAKTITLTHEQGDVKYIIIQNEASLLYIVNLGCIELNPFNSRIKSLENPDYLVWDLDPQDVPFEKVVETAQVIHEILEGCHIRSFCKTSGGRGLHIYVPLHAKYTYAQTKQFAEIVAVMAQQQLSDITSLERMPAKRRNKIYIDILQNEHTKTLASVYCLRPKPHATVSTPLKWDEVKPGLDPSKFNIKTIFKRLEKLGDIFSLVLGPGIDIGKAIRHLEKM